MDDWQLQGLQRSTDIWIRHCCWVWRGYWWTVGGRQSGFISGLMCSQEVLSREMVGSGPSCSLIIQSNFQTSIILLVKCVYQFISKVSRASFSSLFLQASSLRPITLKWGNPVLCQEPQTLGLWAEIKTQICSHCKNRLIVTGTSVGNSSKDRLAPTLAFPVQSLNLLKAKLGPGMRSEQEAKIWHFWKYLKSKWSHYNWYSSFRYTHSEWLWYMQFVFL